MQEAQRPDNWKYAKEHDEGLRVLVTGGTTGIGRTTALLLASHGAKVLLFGRHEEPLQVALREIREAGGEVHGLTADHAKLADVERVFAAVDEHLGGLDVLINNAAVPAESVSGTALEQLEYQVRADLLGYLACTALALPRLKASGRGHVINVGSMSAESRGASSNIYVACKAGIRAWSQALAKEVNEEGIKVTLIEPGLVGADFGEQSQEEQERQQEELTMLRTEDIAEAIHYAITQPKRTEVVMLQIKPVKQVQK